MTKFDSSGLGKWSRERTFAVTRERLAEYAAATNDPITAHKSGDVASPVFAIVPVFESMLEPLFNVVPKELAGFGVHSAQEFVFHRPIEPGDTLVARGQMAGFDGKPNGTRGHVVMESRTPDGELVNSQHITVFVRGVDAGETIGEPAPGHAFPEALRGTEPLATVSQKVDEDQTFRYSPAAGDPMPIHLDAEFAKKMGLPGIIVHGLCTFAFASWAVLTEVADSDVRRLRRFAGRFAKPVLPGQELTTRIWQGDGGTFHFETSVGDDVVVKDGLVELR
ncbi:MaoC/PaaZ C-terminal domain-containing protein [Nocardia fluminea]|uniref:MaoC/PaaZ C-terminal domain-containing protein n=1 Tax=Nocardia fluminea TaxID=134984 RepID=UPI003710A587